MLQSQILTSITNLVLNNKDREISFKKGNYLLGEDTMTDSRRDIIEQKYIGFDVISGGYIYNWVYKNDELVFFNIFRRIFKRNFYTYRTFPYLRDRAKLDTIFKIQNNKEFIISFLEFIDTEKKTLHIKDAVSSQEYILDKIKSSKEKLGVSKFPLSFSIKQYLGEAVLIYEELLKLSDMYEIENIQIFNGNIIFSLSQIGEENTVVTYQNRIIRINNKPVGFKKMDGGNKTEEIFHLVFQYFKENNVSTVGYFELEEYLKHNNHFKALKTLKFSDEGIRGYLSGKNIGIQKDFGISNFLTNNVSSISCEYYIPLKD